jgi:hypothetical protein
MVESICGQGFAYACEVEKERLRKLVKLEQKVTAEIASRQRRLIKNLSPAPIWLSPFIGVMP